MLISICWGQCVNPPLPSVPDAGEVTGSYTYTVEFTCPGDWSFTMPSLPGYDDHVDAVILVVGAGGGGGRGDILSPSAGGGGGGQVIESSAVLSPGMTFTVKVGAGGVGGPSGNADGGNGGSSSFGFISAAGGKGGEGGLAGSGGESGAGFPGGNGEDNDYDAGGGGGGAHGEGVNGLFYYLLDFIPTAIGGNGGGGYNPPLSGGLFGAVGGGMGLVPGNGGSTGLGGNASPFIFIEASSGAANTGSGGGAGYAARAGDGADGYVRLSFTLSVLPVQWDKFKVTYSNTDRKATLHWSTSKEWESSHFEVERSENGVSSFVKLYEVPAVGWSDRPSEYKVEDHKLPLFGQRLYYRVKEVGLDGSFSYSQTVALNIPDLPEQKGAWKVYPNPGKAKDIRIGLMDGDVYSGGEINIRVISSFNMSEQFTAGGVWELNEKLVEMLLGYQSGLVLIEIEWGGKVEYLKVLLK
ncbi:hypothetical protein IFO69_07175 [Echinicola sp. CAU 1574]|uniref:Glycine-rich domain-containing protein n=1 Tax=Echinicola arenosa TaxID=2774144 RepID=A0ABR9AI93_9BACT|nr:hypothetical protein [Echinicola arenosa]MBD8488518.1 hypothetical protein [Echinicola arenosa]